jgi:prepilin-type N-terminal cleavage/methylation domain-containing protein
MKRAFTLIELIIVLVIISILMGATMRFGSSRITDLKSQALKDKFLDSYATVYSQNMVSSYYQAQHYQSLHIRIGADVQYDYDSGVALSLFRETGAMSISWLALDALPQNEITLTFVPYHMWCSIDAWSGVVSFQLMVKPAKTYCFSLMTDTCNLREVTCL